MCMNCCLLRSEVWWDLEALHKEDQPYFSLSVSARRGFVAGLGGLKKRRFSFHNDGVSLPELFLLRFTRLQLLFYVLEIWHYVTNWIAKNILWSLNMVSVLSNYVKFSFNQAFFLKLSINIVCWFSYLWLFFKFYTFLKLKSIKCFIIALIDIAVIFLINFHDLLVSPHPHPPSGLDDVGKSAKTQSVEH